MEARTGQILFINLVEIGHSDLEDLYFSFSSQAGASCSVQFIFWDVVFNVDIKHSCRQWCPNVFAWSLTGIRLWIPSFAEQHRVCSAWWEFFSWLYTGQEAPLPGFTRVSMSHCALSYAQLAWVFPSGSFRTHLSALWCHWVQLRRHLSESA